MVHPQSTPPEPPAVLPLVLGGHSFIQQLGMETRPSDTTAASIVAACFAHGITWFDTTYQPERIALGRALKRLNAHDQATILAWNFFQDFDDSGEVGGPSYYRPESIDILRRQLQTDVIDILVVHAMGDADENQRQEALAVSWRERGLVRRLGTWCPGADITGGVYDLAIAPGNVADNGKERFSHYKAQGWETLATSPFVRGRLLERLARKSGVPTEEIADLMLRFAAFLPQVDRLVVSIREPGLVEKNAASYRRGPLSQIEKERLQILFTDFGNE